MAKNLTKIYKKYKPKKYCKIFQNDSPNNYLQKYLPKTDLEVFQQKNSAQK